MNKREMFKSFGFKLGEIAIIAAGINVGRSMFTEANASNRNSASWRVPPGVTKIRVRSWKANGSKDMDRTLTVEPGDFFRLDAIED